MFLIVALSSYTARAGADTDSLYFITTDVVKHMHVAEDIIKKGKDSFSLKNGDGKIYTSSDIVAGSYDAAKKKDKIAIVEYRKIDKGMTYKIVSGKINIYRYGDQYYTSGNTDRAFDMDSRTRFSYHIQKGDFEEPTGLRPSGIYYKSKEYTNDEVYKMFSDYAPAKAILDSFIKKKKYISLDAMIEAAKVYNNQ